MTEVVKSSYVVDPNDEMGLIRRNNDGTEIDREYWDRVNQGDNVLNAAKMFEQNSQTEERVAREPVRSRVLTFPKTNCTDHQTDL